MISVSDILNHATQLNPSAKKGFYARLGFALTISIRSIWSDESLNDHEKIEAIKVVNELHHQLFNWMLRISNEDATFSDRDCFNDMNNFARQNERARSEIGNALVSTYTRLASAGY